MSWTEADPRNIFGSAPIKAEGATIAHNLSSGSGSSLVYSTAKGRSYTTMSPLVIQEGDKKIIVGEMLQRLEYILQRAVPNYDELSKQFDAIKDIERSNNEY
jgi:hypothetical protein